MKNIILSGILILAFQVLFSQENTQQTDSTKTMEKSDYLGLRTTVYKVPNLAEAKEWYSKAFITKPYFDEPFYVGFNIGGYELGLLPEENPVTEKTKSIVTYWGVNDIEKVYNHLLSIGATEHEKPTNVGGELMVASVIDLWGNVIGIIYNPAFKLE
jgi:predicted enzyme related to lactoylglutathione lyase